MKLADILEERGVPRVRLSVKKVRSLRYRLRQKEGRRIPWHEVMGGIDSGDHLCRIMKRGSAPSIQTLTRLYTFFHEHGLLFDFMELLEPVPDKQHAQSDKRASG